MPTPTLATLARRLARAGATTRATRGAHALALRATRVESSARANDALVARDEDVVTLTLQRATGRATGRRGTAGDAATAGLDAAGTRVDAERRSRARRARSCEGRTGRWLCELGPTTTLVGPRCAYVFEPATSVAKNIVDALRTWVSERARRREARRGGADGEGFSAGGARVRARGEFAIF